MEKTKMQSHGPEKENASEIAENPYSSSAIRPNIRKAHEEMMRWRKENPSPYQTEEESRPSRSYFHGSNNLFRIDKYKDSLLVTRPGEKGYVLVKPSGNRLHYLSLNKDKKLVRGVSYVMNGNEEISDVLETAKRSVVARVDELEDFVIRAGPEGSRERENAKKTVSSYLASNFEKKVSGQRFRSAIAARINRTPITVESHNRWEELYNSLNLDDIVIAS